MNDFRATPQSDNTRPAEKEESAVKAAPREDPGVLTDQRAKVPFDPWQDDKEREKKKKKKEKAAVPAPLVGRAAKKAAHRRIAGRIALCFGSLIAFLLIAVILTCVVLLNGSATMRKMLVNAAIEASATKWIPPLFLDAQTITDIIEESNLNVIEVVSMDPGNSGEGGVFSETDEDEWADAVDGIRFLTLTRPNFQAYMLIVRDPSRVFVGWGSDYANGQTGGKKIFAIAEKYNAVAAVNGGEFSDVGGVGKGDLPMGLTYSQGTRYAGSTNKTFIGFDKNNKLVVTEGMSVERATALGIRDGVSFQQGNALITNDGTQRFDHYADGDTAVAQRTCIGQRADGAVLLLVTDGRTAQSLGATHNDCIEILLEYGAVVAGNLDGGSSSMMYYRDYFNLYHYDTSTLDEYQKQGLVNKYKAFTKPRTVPTYFVVGEARDNG